MLVTGGLPDCSLPITPTHHSHPPSVTLIADDWSGRFLFFLCLPHLCLFCSGEGWEVGGWEVSFCFDWHPYRSLRVWVAIFEANKLNKASQCFVLWLLTVLQCLGQEMTLSKTCKHTNRPLLCLRQTTLVLSFSDKTRRQSGNTSYHLVCMWIFFQCRQKELNVVACLLGNVLNYMWFKVDFASPLSNSLRESGNLCYNFHWVCCKVMSSVYTVFTKGSDLKHKKKAWLLILNRWLCSKGRDAPNPLWLWPYVPSSAQLSTLIRHICFPMNPHSPTEMHTDRTHARPYGKSTTGKSLK